MAVDDRHPLTMRFPGPLYERLRRVAFETRATMTDVVMQGTEARVATLEAEIAESGERQHAEALAESGPHGGRGCREQGERIMSATEGPWIVQIAGSHKRQIREAPDSSKEQDHA